MRFLLSMIMAFVWLTAAMTTGRADGIAIVQAVEQSGGVCTGSSAAKAFDCAKKKCVKGGAAREDCLEMARRLDGWTVDVFMQSTEGPHWREYHCGWSTRTEAEAAGARSCNAERKTQLMECARVQIYDPKGKRMMAE